MGFSFEVGAEAAYNTLDSTVELYELDEGGERIRVNLSIDDAEVREKRGEVYVALGKSLSPSLRLDGGINYEVSSLSVRGDAQADRSLRFLKPNVAIDWKPVGDWHARLSIKRTVAQLNFYDFISFAELSNDRVTGGNAELLPQRTWEVRATIDRPILGDGLVKLDLGLDRVSKLQDQILTAEGLSAPGNLGTGRRRFARLTVDAPLSQLGLSGVTIKAYGQVQRTRVLDPISESVRDFSGYFPRWEWEVEARRDAGQFSYGFKVNDRARFSFFRADEIDMSFNGGAYGTAFIEYRPTPRTSVTLDVDNLFSTTGNRERIFFSPNRSVPEHDEREFRERNRHLSFGLTFKQTLGFGLGGGVARQD